MTLGAISNVCNFVGAHVSEVPFIRKSQLSIKSWIVFVGFMRQLNKIRISSYFFAIFRTLVASISMYGVEINLFLVYSTEIHPL